MKLYARGGQQVTIDYARMKRVYPQQKAALTRAMHKPEDKRREAVIATCKRTVAEWDEIGAWPDEWSRWQRALDDSGPWNERIDLRDLA